MSKITELLHHATIAISDQSDTILSKFFLWAGLSGSSAGIVSGVVSATKDSAKTVASEPSFFADNLGIICGIGGLSCAAINMTASIYFNYRDNKRKQEMHMQNLKGDK